MYDAIVHYHVYKNAGTSIDAALQAFFGDQHLEFDKHPDYKNQIFNRKNVEPIACKAISSHSFVATIHRSKVRNYFPIIFLRHPLLRAASVYRFERNRNDIAAAESAKKYGFPSWLEWGMKTDNYFDVNNFQTGLISMPENGARAPGFDEPTKTGNLGVCVDRLDEIPIVGIVEYFDKSVSVMERLLESSFPGISLNLGKSNVTGTDDWKSELIMLQEKVPHRVLSRFYECNQNDYLLYEVFRNKLTNHSGSD